MPITVAEEQFHSTSAGTVKTFVHVFNLALLLRIRPPPLLHVFDNPHPRKSFRPEDIRLRALIDQLYL